MQPDEGMRGLFPHRRAPAPSPAGPLIGAELGAQLEVRIGELADAADRLARARMRDQCEWAECHPIPLAPVAIPAAGNVIDERWAPRTDWAWQVVLLSVTFGAGATAATVYEASGEAGLIAANALRNFAPNAGGMDWWEPKGLIVLPNQALSWQAAGGGITVSGRAVEISMAKLADYLM